MFSSNHSVPFKIVDINHGLQEAEGLLKIEDDKINFEFEVKDTLIGFVKSEVKTVKVPFRDLKSISFKKGLFSTKIILKGVSMKVFDGLPGVEVATCTLKIKRKDKKEAEKLVSKAKVALSEYKLDEM